MDEFSSPQKLLFFNHHSHRRSVWLPRHLFQTEICVHYTCTGRSSSLFKKCKYRCAADPAEYTLWTRCQSSWLWSRPLPPFSLHPWSYFLSLGKTGSTSMQMSAARKVAPAPSQTPLSLSHTSIKKREYAWKTSGQRSSRHWEHPVVCTILAKLDRALGWSGVVCWQGLSFCLYPSLSFSVSLSFLSFSLSELRPGYSWACCVVLEENCQSGLLWLNTESRSFIKELICYSLPLTHSSFSHTFTFFHWLTVLHSNFLSWSFLKLHPPPHPHKPTRPCVRVKSLLVSLSILQIV